MSVDLRRSAVPRYLQLAALFRRLIVAGEWPIGGQIPTVKDLATKYNVASATIRQALGILERENLIERFRAKGTFVRHCPSEKQWFEIGADWSSQLSARYSTAIEVLSEIPNVTLQDIAYPAGTLVRAYRQVRRLHWRHDVPFMVTQLHIDECLYDQIDSGELSNQTTSRLIAGIPTLDIGDGRLTLTIDSADAEFAPLLKLPLNAPIACIHKRFLNRKNELLVISNGVCRGDIFRMDFQLFDREPTRLK